MTFQQVGKRYPDGTVAVESIDLVAPTGRITVLVGPSGCGKTTLLRMVNRMISPTSGQVLLDGVDVQSVPAPRLRRGIGYVIQHAGLFPHRTIEDNIATVPRLLGWDRRKARTRALELLETVGLDASHAKRYPFQLSSGQQQRVGVARALAADPPVLLMDEPFSAVDPVVRKDLQTELLRLQSELGKTILFVTHDIDEAILLGDRVAVLRVGGVLAQFAAPAELLAHPEDEFVEGFLGLDRGVRRLSFFGSDVLRLHSEPVVARSADPTDVRRVATTEPWLLIVDDERRPLGWLRAEDVPASDDLREVDIRSLTPFGHAFTAGSDSLRAALDSSVLVFKDFQALDTAGPITVRALKDGDVQIATLFTTDPNIPANGFKVLDDPKHVFAAQNVTPLTYRASIDAKAAEVLNEISAKMDTPALAAMMQQVIIGKKDIDIVGEAWLKSAGLVK